MKQSEKLVVAATVARERLSAAGVALMWANLHGAEGRRSVWLQFGLFNSDSLTVNSFNDANKVKLLQVLLLCVQTLNFGDFG